MVNEDHERKEEKQGRGKESNLTRKRYVSTINRYGLKKRATVESGIR